MQQAVHVILANQEGSLELELVTLSHAKAEAKFIELVKTCNVVPHNVLPTEKDLERAIVLTSRIIIVDIGVDSQYCRIDDVWYEMKDEYGEQHVRWQEHLLE